MFKKKKKKKKRIRKILIGACGVLLLALLVLLTVLLIRLFSCGAKEASVDLSAASAVPTAAATLLPTDPPAATPTPYVTPVPKITDAWYAERNEALTQHVRAFSGLTDEEAIQKRVEGMAIDPDQKMVAFTFDDGPRDELTDGVLDVCEQYNVRVTFFIKGAYIAGHEPQLKRMLALGCEIGNHTWDHLDIEKLTTEEMRYQIEQVDDTLYNVLGVRTKLFRPPYISYGQKGSDTRNALIELMQKHGMAVINHTRSTHDTYDNYTEDMIYERMIAEKDESGYGLHKSIVLCHDKTQKTIGAFRRAVPVLLEQGYQLVTVSELLNCSDEGFRVGAIYKKAD